MRDRRQPCIDLWNTKAVLTCHFHSFLTCKSSRTRTVRDIWLTNQFSSPVFCHISQLIGTNHSIIILLSGGSWRCWSNCPLWRPILIQVKNFFSQEFGIISTVYHRVFLFLIPAKLHFELDRNFPTVEMVVFQIVTILLFHPSKAIGQFAIKFPGWPLFE